LQYFVDGICIASLHVMHRTCNGKGAGSIVRRGITAYQHWEVITHTVSLLQHREFCEPSTTTSSQWWLAHCIGSTLYSGIWRASASTPV